MCACDSPGRLPVVVVVGVVVRNNKRVVDVMLGVLVRVQDGVCCVVGVGGVGGVGGVVGVAVGVVV